jgi:two-component system LytT family response regulator
MNILIVDDEPLALDRLERLLGSLGYVNVVRASSAADALELARSRPFEIAFLDISMSQMDGIELGYALRYEHENLAIVYQTAHENHALRAFDVGAVDYLLKPYSAEQLARAIERVQAKTPPRELRLIAKTGENHLLLTPNDILYVKADLAETILRTAEGFAYYPKKISDLEPLLEPHGFLRVHRSYLINLNRIRGMETVDQSRIRFTFEGIKEYVDSSKEGAKQFRNRFK